MKVVVAYMPGQLAQATVLALEMEHLLPGPQYCPTHEAEDSYFRLLERLWNEQETFVLLEQDIVPWPGAVQQLYLCEEDWCAFPYRLNPYNPECFLPALGCVKFSSNVMRSVPRLLEYTSRNVGNYFWGDTPTRSWRQLDDRIYLVLRSELGVSGPHIHMPPVTHLNRRYSHKGVIHEAESGMR